jgi:hypothetical protein
MGLQAVYMAGSIRKKGDLNVLVDISTLEANEFNLEPGDFIKSIDCLTNSKGIIVGISMVSASRVIFKGGAMTSSRHSIKM